MKIISLFCLFVSLSAWANCPQTHYGEPQLLGVEKDGQAWTFHAEDGFGPFSIQVSFFEATKRRWNFWSEPNPVAHLILFPTIDGESLLERQSAKYFSRRGYRVAIPTIEEIKQDFGEQTLCMMEGTYRRVQAAAKFISEEMNRGRADEAKLFLMGASQGGIRSIMAAAALDDVEAIWVSVAGGDFPSIYANSQVPEIEAFRRQHMQALQLFEPQDYEEYLRAHLKLDPLLDCPALKGRMAMVVATQDHAVPTANQRLLKESCRPEKLWTVEAGHWRGVVDLYFKRIQIRHFFEQL